MLCLLRMFLLCVWNKRKKESIIWLVFFLGGGGVPEDSGFHMQYKQAEGALVSLWAWNKGLD